MSAGAAGGAGAAHELAHLGVVEGHGQDAGGAEDEGLEGNHGCDFACSVMTEDAAGGEEKETDGRTREIMAVYIHIKEGI